MHFSNWRCLFSIVLETTSVQLLILCTRFVKRRNSHFRTTISERAILSTFSKKENRVSIRIQSPVFAVLIIFDVSEGIRIGHQVVLRKRLQTPKSCWSYSIFNKHAVDDQMFHQLVILRHTFRTKWVIWALYYGDQKLQNTLCSKECQCITLTKQKCLIW